MAHINLFIVLAFLIASCSDILFAANSDVPVGHMKPFGAHLPPEKVDEFNAGIFPSPENFWKDYVRKAKPVVFRGAAKQSPSFEKWTDEYLKEQYGQLEVRLEAKKEKQGYIPVGDVGIGRDTIKNFIDTYHTANKYIVSDLPSQMYKDIMVLPSLSCGGMSRRVVEVDWWMNGGNASSIIHKDAFNQINCLMNGTKEWKLIEYKHEESIYKAWEEAGQIGGYSRINPNKVDLLKYPKVASLPWKFTVMNAGDCLFLPGSMYHQVTSYGAHNFAVSLLYSRFKSKQKLDFTDCSDNVNYTSLSNIDVDWPYQGTGAMPMGGADLEDVREVIASFINKKDDVLYKFLRSRLQFQFVEEDPSLTEKKTIEARDKIFKTLGGKLNRKTVRNLSKKQLRTIGLVYQPVDASNTYDHEYTYVDSFEIQNLIKKLTRKHGRLERKLFIKQYKTLLFGTEQFANRIFDIIAGTSADTATPDQIKANTAEALKKYFQLQRKEAPTPAGETSEGDAYDGTNVDTEMMETGMPDMTDDDDTGMPDMTDNDDTGMPDMTDDDDTGMPDMTDDDDTGMPDMTDDDDTGMTDDDEDVQHSSSPREDSSEATGGPSADRDPTKDEL